MLSGNRRKVFACCFVMCLVSATLANHVPCGHDEPTAAATAAPAPAPTASPFKPPVAPPPAAASPSKGPVASVGGAGKGVKAHVVAERDKDVSRATGDAEAAEGYVVAAAAA